MTEKESNRATVKKSLTVGSYTPGPWKVDKFGIITGGPDFCTSIGSVCSHTTPSDSAEAFNRRAGAANVILRGNRNFQVEAKANAQLIAKSPLLPEAIEALKELIVEFIPPDVKFGRDKVRKAVDLISRYEAKP